MLYSGGMLCVGHVLLGFRYSVAAGVQFGARAMHDQKFALSIDTETSVCGSFRVLEIWQGFGFSSGMISL